jgi:alkylation response protein AidB-like acyl-CoA dehydrogenase
MNFDLTEDQREIKRTARDFLAARYTPEKIRAIALDGRPDPHWDEIAELGWPDIAEFGIVELAVVAEELGYALAPSPLAAHWAAKLLHPSLEGRGTVAMWDAGGGADPEASTLLAEDGKLTGVKIAVPNADVADTLVVTASGGRHFAVEASDATIEPARALDATRPLFTVRLDGAPGEELDGAFGHAWHAIAVMAAAESVGVAARVSGDTVAYAKERKQFGRPIGSYQAVSHACAQMFLETEGARSVTFWAAWALDHDPDTAYMAANCAKAYASDAAVNVVRSALQVHGGIGFTWEHDLHLFLKRAEANAHAFGDARWHREQVAAAML